MPAFGKMPSLKSVTSQARRLPTRMLLYAHEKWGKTSFAAHAPAPVFLMSRGETGLETLIQSGRLPPTNHFPDAAEDWGDILHAVKVLTEEDHPHKTFVLDTANGSASMCAESVCKESFEGSWGSFGSYGRGIAVTVPEWSRLLVALDELRERRSMAVILLCHAKVQSFKNPTGTDYDRYQPEMDKNLWSVTHKWADVIAFGSFVVTEKKTGDKDKVKAIGGQQRVLHCERSAAFDAGNRYGLPATVNCGASAKAAWDAFAKAIGATLNRGAKASDPKVEEPAGNGQVGKLKPGDENSDPEPALVGDAKE